MKIGELALATRTQVETIRHYEREGLLPQPPRSQGNYRIYGAEHVQRLAFVRHCRALDMALEEIRMLLRFSDEPLTCCGEVNAVLDRHIDHVADRVRELRHLQRQLKALRQQCTSVEQAAHGGVLRGFSRAPSVSDGPAAAKSARRHPAGTHA